MICFSTWIMHHFETGFNDTCIGLSWASFMIFVIFWFSSGPAFRQDSVFWRFAGRRQLPSTYVIFKSQHTSNPDSVSTYFFPCLIYVPPPHSVSMPRLTWMIEYDGWIRTKMGQGFSRKKTTLAPSSSPPPAPGAPFPEQKHPMTQGTRHSHQHIQAHLCTPKNILAHLSTPKQIFAHLRTSKHT